MKDIKNIYNYTSWKKLYKHYLYIKNNSSINKLFINDKKRFYKFSKNFNNLIFLDYSKNIISNKTIKLLFELAKECNIEKNIKNLFNGNYYNNTEKKFVLYPMLRYTNNNNFNYKNNIIQKEILKSIKKIEIFCNNFDNNKWLGYSNNKITDIVNIGIGGSDIGVKMVIEALDDYKKKDISIHFISNIDGICLSKVLNNLDHSTTLFIISSKSFKTEETLINAKNAKDWFLEKSKNKYYLNKHFIIISENEESSNIFGISKDNFFKIFDWVNGRFSIWSSIGLVISLVIGFKNFKKILYGANKMDNHFKNSKLENNIPLILSLISIWYNNFFKFETEAIIPYSNNMLNFCLYYQQLSMESNGKNIDKNNNLINYQTSPISFGYVGTDSQHTFFQLMHQGTKTVPCDFIMLCNTNKKNLFYKNHDYLVSNCISQSMSLAFGNNISKESNLFYKNCLGNKPNNFLIIKNLDPFTLGALIAMYEHKIFCFGTILNICSFDQWGVELGKICSKKIFNDLINKDLYEYNYDNSTNNLIKIYKNWKNK